jgi:hypothetical protein
MRDRLITLTRPLNLIVMAAVLFILLTLAPHDIAVAIAGTVTKACWVFILCLLPFTFFR